MIIRILYFIFLTLFFFSFRLQVILAQPANWGATSFYTSVEMTTDDVRPDVHYIVASDKMGFSIDVQRIMVLDDAAQKENILVLEGAEPEEGTVITIYNGDGEPILFEGISLPADHESDVLYLFGQWHKAYNTKEGWEIME